MLAPRSVNYVSGAPGSVEPVYTSIPDRQPSFDVAFFHGAYTRGLFASQPLKYLVRNAWRVSAVLSHHPRGHEPDIGFHDGMLRADA
jgi:hypothetical protein